MSNELKSSDDEVKQNEDVQRGLSLRHKGPVAGTRDKLVIGTHVLLLIGLGVFYRLLNLSFFDFAAPYKPLIQKLILAAAVVTGCLALLRLVEVYLIGRVANQFSRYNLIRVLHLVAWVLIAFLVVSILFQNWYTAVVSFGLISLILGFALQTPITSFIGWIYILVREPYRFGDRIKIGDASGRVIDISYFDTSLWEFGGDDLSIAHPTGRVIKFPNSSVLSTAVYNYTWPVFPYIWNEVKFHIAYDSDLEFVASTMQRFAEREVGEVMMQQVRVFRELVTLSPVDELQLQDRPMVMFRVSENTWLEAVVRYLVHPKQAGPVKTRLIRDLLASLNSEPERVRFPKGNAR